MKTSTKVIVGIVVVFILWVCFVAYEKEVNTYPVTPYIVKPATEVFPSNVTPVKNPKG